MAHKKAGGSSRNGRDTAGRRLGIKKFGGEAVVETLILQDEDGLAGGIEFFFCTIPHGKMLGAGLHLAGGG